MTPLQIEILEEFCEAQRLARREAKVRLVAIADADDEKQDPQELQLLCLWHKKPPKLNLSKRQLELLQLLGADSSVAKAGRAMRLSCRGVRDICRSLRRAGLIRLSHDTDKRRSVVAKLTREAQMLVRGRVTEPLEYRHFPKRSRSAWF